MCTHLDVLHERLRMHHTFLCTESYEGELNRLTSSSTLLLSECLAPARVSQSRKKTFQSDLLESRLSANLPTGVLLLIQAGISQTLSPRPYSLCPTH